MTEHNTQVPFVSYVKIKGIHLLPPVITQKRRAELQGYKQQAIKLEKRLKNCRDLKKNLEDLLNLQPLTERPFSEISFRDDTHVEALGITNKSTNIDKSSNNNVPSQTKPPRKIRLTKDIIDVTQYNSDGIKIICDDVNYTTVYQGHHHVVQDNNAETVDTNTYDNSKQIECLFPLGDNLNNSNSENSDLNSTKLSQINCSIEDSSLKDISSLTEKSPKPRLIRSNSYTIETPSPILLAHLEKTEKNGRNNEFKNIEDIKNVSISRNWSSLENNYVPFENSEFSSINTVYNADLNDSKKEDIPTTTFTEKKQLPTSERSSSPAIKVVQTDISVQKITVNANNEILDEALNENSETSDSQLLQVLKTLPDIYAKQIIDLIETQKLDKQKAMDKSKIQVSKKEDNPKTSVDNNENFHNAMLKMNMRNECSSLNASVSGSEKLQGSTTSLSPSQSIYYSVTSSDTLRPLSNPSVRLIDFDCDDVLPPEGGGSTKKTDITEYYIHELKRGVNVCRQLFPQLDESTIQNIRKEWAASIIGAHVKGYLTRRLLKTDRVQSLIETIKDALMCALQLHNAENIDESDVELHRRLINQVSAACFTFHDIFFVLSVQEQMLIIATDRQRKLEKAKRPTSAPSVRTSKSSSNRSTPRQRLSSHSRSLTKV